MPSRKAVKGRQSDCTVVGQSNSDLPAPGPALLPAAGRGSGQGGTDGQRQQNGEDSGRPEDPRNQTGLSCQEWTGRLLR